MSAFFQKIFLDEKKNKLNTFLNYDVKKMLR